MSATEQMRAMLDGLMGTARDGSDSKRQHLHFTDSRVCRAFLLDCCPHDIFASTKLELGDCSKVHDPALRADYQIANQQEDHMYELSALERLQSFVNEADKKTDYLKRKLAETQEHLTADETNKLNRVHDLTEKLGKKLAQVDKAEADGDQEAKQKFLDEAEKIKKERVVADAEYKEVSRPASSHQQQNLKVCDICSAYLGIHDNDTRLADHFGGKLHLGFITVREKLEDLRKIASEKRSRKGGIPSERSSSSNHRGGSDRERERVYDHGYERGQMRDYDRDYRGRSRDYERSYRDRDYDRYRDRARDVRYRDRERDRSRSSSRYYREENNSRSRDRYRDERLDRPERGIDRAERQDSATRRGVFDRLDTQYQEREVAYQRKLREWEKRESEKSKKFAIRCTEEQDRKQLEEQESRKLKEFLEDYKDERDDVRFYRSGALARRLADRRKEMEQDKLSREKEKMELEMLSRTCNLNNTEPQSIEHKNHATTISTSTSQDHSSQQSNGAPDNNALSMANHETSDHANTISIFPPSTTSKVSSNDNQQSQSIVQQLTQPLKQSQHQHSQPQNQSQQQPIKSSSSDDKRKLVEELIGRIPTDKDQLFARELDWSLLDEHLMEKRIRPWVTKKIAEYMGEKEVDLIDFVCTLLNNHTDGNSMLREVAIVLDDEAEKFVVHMWRLLIFELEAKQIGLRK